MCLGMNPDILAPGERSASTSNRNFEGRQGKGGRTHLVSPRRRRGHRDRRPLHAPPEDLYDGTDHASSRAPRCRSTAPTSTPTRSSPPSTSSGSSAPASDRSCSPSGARTRLRPQRPAYAGASILHRRARTSAAGPAASTRRGRSRTPGSARSSRRASRTSSATTARRSGCCRSSCAPESVRALMDAVLDDPTTRIVVDLERRSVTAPGLDGEQPDLRAVAEDVCEARRPWSAQKLTVLDRPRCVPPAGPDQSSRPPAGSTHRRSAGR